MDQAGRLFGPNVGFGKLLACHVEEGQTFTCHESQQPLPPEQRRTSVKL